MKCLLLIGLLLPVLAPAQHNKHEKLASRWFKDSSGVYIGLHAAGDIRLYRQPHLFTDTERGLIVSSDTAYKALFKTISDSLPVIDFTTHYLLGRRSCVYCGPHCTHSMCHRNACRFLIYWVLLPREQSPATLACGIRPSVN